MKVVVNHIVKHDNINEINLIVQQCLKPNTFFYETNCF